MGRRYLSIRWWLALAFAVVAALTAFAIASVFQTRASHAFRERATELFAGSAFVTAEDLVIAVDAGVTPKGAVDDAAGRRGVSLLLVDPKGKPLARAGDFAIPGQPIEKVDREALATALAGKRFVGTADGGRRLVVAIPLRTGEFGALVVRGSQPELPAELGIVRHQIVEAALLAVGVGSLAGLVIALLISLRLRRIARAAAAIERGDFESPMRARFHDEVGSLIDSVDHMRERLRATFAQLESDRDRLHLLLNGLRQGVVTVRPDLRVDFANEAATSLLPGLASDDDLPEPWPSMSLREFAAAVHEGIEPAEQRIENDDQILSLIGIPAADSAILVVTDISRRERLERAEREFVSNAAHELRTPLTTILGAVEALQAGAREEPVERDHFLDLIHREARRLARLARALLVLARAQTAQEAPRAERIAIAPMLRLLADEVPPRPALTVELDAPPEVAALGDPDLLEQALRNLVDNAVKYTRTGTVTLSARRNAAEVVIEVADTGLGIDPGDGEQVFDRFHRGGPRDADGFGLGLAIVAQAVRVLGGTVSLRPRSGGGTIARLTLPAAAAHEVAA
jgi:signal transduction histidine kinase